MMNKAVIVATISVLVTAQAWARGRDGSSSNTSTRSTNLEVFEGVISAINTTQQLVTVTGHELLHVTETTKTHRNDYNSRDRHRGPESIRSTTHVEKSEKETTKIFKVAPLCKISVPNKPVALLQDLRPKDFVSISYSEITSPSGRTASTASSITKK